MWNARGNQGFAYFRETGAKRHETQGYSFVPSPSANLVGVAKELQQGLSLTWRDLRCASRLSTNNEADIRSSQRKKFRSKGRNFFCVLGITKRVFFSVWFELWYVPQIDQQY